MDFALEIQILDGGRIYIYVYIYYAYILSWIARVVFLARTLLCVWAEKEKRKKIDFSRFLRGKGMQKQKKHACVRAEKEKKKIFRFFPFFAGKRYAEKKVQHMRSGRERKKEKNSIFPVFRGEKVCRND
jgi:hypothetical protein